MTAPPQDPPPVALRAVEDGDLETFFRQQLDPEAARMAAFPPRDRVAFMAHWARIRADPAATVMTVVSGDLVAGNVVSWDRDAHRVVGYWIGRDHWGRGIGTAALREFLGVETTRPLFAHVATHNLPSIRVLEKCGFNPVEDANLTAAPEDGVEEILMRFDGPRRS